nr:zinc finger, CCHC-type [Tanacetum cinerariifolium]
MITPYELWTKRKQNLNYLKVWGCRAVVRLPDPKLKTLDERGIECIFIGYVKPSKAFRFYVIKANESVLINFIIESRDVIFDENRFSSVLRPSQRSLINRTKDIGGLVVPEELTEEVVTQQPKPNLKKAKENRTSKNFGPEFQLYLIEGTRDEKEAINDEMDSILDNNTWMLADLPLVANLLMDVKITFLNGKLDEEVYMNQPQGFIIHGNENKVCKPVKSLYGLKHAPKKFDEASKGVIICLYVHDMLIFDTNQVQVDMTKEFLSSKFSMKDIGEADVILGITILPKERLNMNVME